MIDGIVDCNVLLDFAHVSAIDVLAAFFGDKACVVEHVRKVELQKGTQKGLPDPCLLGGKEWVTTIDDMDTDEYQMSQDLVLRLGQHHKGEADAIAICYHRGLVFCSRDASALKLALNRGVRVATTTSLLNEMIRHKHLTYDDALDLARKIQAARNAVSPDDLLRPRC